MIADDQNASLLIPQNSSQCENDVVNNSSKYRAQNIDRVSEDKSISEIDEALSADEVDGNVSKNDVENTSNHNTAQSHRAPIGSHIEIFWDGDNVFYPGKVIRFEEATGTHIVVYDNDDEEYSENLAASRWRYVRAPGDDPSKVINTKVSAYYSTAYDWT